MMYQLIAPALKETIIMVTLSTFFALLIGFPLAIILFITKDNGLKENKTINKILNLIINIFRSIPFVILIVMLFPLSRWIVGTKIGTKASIVPLSLSAAPFVARVIEGNLLDLDTGLIELGKSLGADTSDIISKILIPEALPSIVSGITLTIINIIGLSAMAGIIGGGGLGDLAMRYGYNRNDPITMMYTVVVIIILVQVCQFIGNKLAVSLDKNK